MKKQLPAVLLILLSHTGFAQQKWFTIYTDSAALVKNASEVTASFISDVKQLQPSIEFNVKAILNTTPYLIFYYDNGKEKTANLPLWDQVIAAQKSFFMR
jgi:hypothetical protein